MRDDNPAQSSVEMYARSRRALSGTTGPRDAWDGQAHSHKSPLDLRLTLADRSNFDGGLLVSSEKAPLPLF